MTSTRVVTPDTCRYGMKPPREGSLPLSADQRRVGGVNPAYPQFLGSVHLETVVEPVVVGRSGYLHRDLRHRPTSAVGTLFMGGFFRSLLFMMPLVIMVVFGLLQLHSIGGDFYHWTSWARSYGRAQAAQIAHYTQLAHGE